MAGNFFFLWGIEKVKAILSRVKLPQNFIISTSNSTPKFTQQTRGIELASTDCLILVKFQKGSEGSKEGQRLLLALILVFFSLPLPLSILWYELQCVSISITQTP